MTNKIVLASNNLGKIREIQELLSSTGIEVIPQAELNVNEVPENSPTFIENALIKARHAASLTEKPTLADDSGLVVPALNGEPGIYSARYAGEKGSFEKCIEKLLFKLKNKHGQERQAFFYCVLVFLRHPYDPCPIVCEGTWAGTILYSPQGTSGFGYDPIFYDPNQQCSAAELPLEIKNKISHRGEAMTKLRACLKSR